MESILQSSLISEMVAEEQRRAQARNRRRSAIGQGDADRPKTPAAQDNVAAVAAGAVAELRLKEQVLRERETAIRQREERLESECAGPRPTCLYLQQADCSHSIGLSDHHTMPNFSCVN